jgi:hypothetical protein
VRKFRFTKFLPFSIAAWSSGGGGSLNPLTRRENVTARTELMAEKHFIFEQNVKHEARLTGSARSMQA